MRGAQSNSGTTVFGVSSEEERSTENFEKQFSQDAQVVDKPKMLILQSKTKEGENDEGLQLR